MKYSTQQRWIDGSMRWCCIDADDQIVSHSKSYVLISNLVREYNGNEIDISGITESREGYAKPRHWPNEQMKKLLADGFIGGIYFG